MNYDKAQLAADWWIEQMKERCYEIHPHKITKKNSECIIIDDSLQQEFSKFHEVLTEEIKNCLDKHSYLSLTCYYYPNTALSKIFKKAKCSSSYIPFQAEMLIADGLIWVGTSGAQLRKLNLSKKIL